MRLRHRPSVCVEGLERRQLMSTTLISVKTSGEASGGATGAFATISDQYSPDGRWVLFNTTTPTSDIVPATTDTNSERDIFLYDTVNNTRSLLTATADGVARSYLQFGGFQFTNDSKYLVFTSLADGVTATPDTNANTDVFLRDLATGTTRLVTHNVANSAAVGALSTVEPVLTDDSKYIVYQSRALDLTSAFTKTTGTDDIYRYDIDADTSTLVSVNAGGTLPGATSSTDPVVSPDGRFVQFTSSATDLVSGITDSPNTADTFVRDLQSNTTRIVTANSTGVAVGPLLDPRFEFTGDSQFLVFNASETSLVAGLTDVDPDGPSSVSSFAFELASGQMRAVSINAAGNAVVGGRKTAISPSGRYVILTTGSADLVANPDADSPTFFIRDLQASTTVQVRDASFTMFSPDDRFILISSAATDLVPGLADNNGVADAFLYELATGAIQPLVTSVAGNATVSGPFASPALLTPINTVFSNDGRYVAFLSGARDVVATTANLSNADLYVRDLQANTVRRVTRRDSTGVGAGYTPPASTIADPKFTPDGAFLVFVTSGSLDTGLTDINIRPDLFAFDLSNAVITPLALTTAGSFSNSGSGGTFEVRPFTGKVLFDSVAPDLVTNPDPNTGANVNGDVFIADLPAPGSPGLGGGGGEDPGGEDPEPAAPAIAVTGGSAVAILVGDLTPSTTDGTDFGSTPAGTPVTKTFTVTNSGTAALTTSGLIAPAGFSITEGLSANIGAGASDTFTVRLDAAAAGAPLGFVSFQHNVTGSSPFLFNVKGTVTPVITSGSDLAIVGGVVEGVKPGSFLAGAKGGAAKVSVVNLGTEDFAGTIGVEFFASTDPSLDTSADFAIGAPISKRVTLKAGSTKGASISTKFSFPSVPEGDDYFILARVNPGTAATEIGTANNVGASAATVGIAPAFTELAAVTLTAKGKFAAGKRGAASLAIQNNGNVPTGKVSRNIRVVASTDSTIGNSDDIVVFDGPVSVNVKAGASKNVNLKLSLTGITAGLYTLSAAIDANDDDATNDSAATSLPVSVA